MTLVNGVCAVLAASIALHSAYAADRRPKSKIDECMKDRYGIYKADDQLEQKVRNLEHAGICGSLEHVQAVFSQGFDLSKKEFAAAAVDALLRAAKDGYLDILDFLVRSGVPVDSQGEHGETAIHSAARLTHAQGGDKARVIRYLIANGLSVEAPDRFGERPLFMAASDGQIDAFKALMEAGADINARSGGPHNQTTALMIAAFEGHAEIIRLLVERPDLEVNARDADGDTALMYACRSEDRPEVLEALLGSKAIDVNLQDRNGRTALMMAVGGHVGGAFMGLVKRLLKTPGIDLSLRTKDGRDVVEYARDYGTQGDRWDRRYVIPLLEQAKNGHLPAEEPEAESSAGAMSARDVRVFDQILEAIDQGTQLEPSMIAWAQSRIEDYLRETLSPKIDIIMTDYLNLGMVRPENEAQERERLFQSLAGLERKGIAAKLKSANKK